MPTQSSASAIAVPFPDRVIVRGEDLAALIGNVGFTEYFLLLLLGRRAPAAMVKMVDATLVAIAEHGMVPSVLAARMTLAAAPTALQGAVSAGLLGCGEVILGAAESSGRYIRAIADDGGDAAAVERKLTATRREKQSLPGFGHPIHKPEDPRAWRLIAYARELGVAGQNIGILEEIHGQVPRIYGRPLPLNVSGAIAAVLLDADFPLSALKGVPLLARAAGLVAHLLEEQLRPIGFKIADAGAAAITYDGPLPSDAHAQADA
jgi:citrate synthase